MTKRARRTNNIIVKSINAGSTRGVVGLGGRRWGCALGRGGITACKREGDGATPRGSFRLVGVYYRADRVERPRSGLPVRAIRPDDGWCDAAGDRNYNRLVRHPYPVSAERLWREDRLYDLIVVVDYNLRPRVQGRGSAIFMHVARDGFRPTAGCIAMRLDDLRALIAAAGASSRLVTTRMP